MLLRSIGQFSFLLIYQTIHPFSVQLYIKHTCHCDNNKECFFEDVFLMLKDLRVIPA